MANRPKLTIPVSSQDLIDAKAAASATGATLHSLLCITANRMATTPRACGGDFRKDDGGRLGISLPPGMHSALKEIKARGKLSSLSNALRLVLAEAGRRTA